MLKPYISFFLFITTACFIVSNSLYAEDFPITSENTLGIDESLYPDTLRAAPVKSEPVAREVAGLTPKFSEMHESFQNTADVPVKVVSSQEEIEADILQRLGDSENTLLLVTDGKRTRVLELKHDSEEAQSAIEDMIISSEETI